MSDIAHPRPSLIDQCLANIDELKELSESLEKGEDKSTLLSSKARESISLLHQLLHEIENSDPDALEQLTRKITELKSVIGKTEHNSAVVNELFQKVIAGAPSLFKDLEEIENEMALASAVNKANTVFSNPSSSRLTYKEYQIILVLLIKKFYGQHLNAYEKRAFLNLKQVVKNEILDLKRRYDQFMGAYIGTEFTIDELSFVLSKGKMAPKQLNCIKAASEWKALRTSQESSLIDFNLQSLFPEIERIDQLASLETQEVRASILQKDAVDKITLLFPFLSLSEHPRLTQAEFESILMLLAKRDSGGALTPFEQTQIIRLSHEMEVAISSMSSSYLHLLSSYTGSFDFSELQAAIHEKRATSEQIKFVIACKKWCIKRVRTEETLLDFKMLDVYAQSTTYFKLCSLFGNIGALQSEELDSAVLEDLLATHKAHTSAGGGSMRVVVEGAGAVGLYSGLKAFLAGANVTVVNDRSEEYSRKQILFLDRIWKEELRYFLGTKYKELFRDEMEEQCVSLRVVEDLLKVRMVEFSSFIQEKDGGYLNLHYELDVKGVVANKSRTGYQIEVASSHKLSAMSRYEQEAIKRRAETIMRNEYPGMAPDDFIDGIRFVSQVAYEKATEEYALEKEFQRSASNQMLEGDLLICCGGAHDRIRSEYLSPIVSHTKPKIYQIGVFLRLEDPAEVLEIPKLRSLISEATFLSAETIARFASEIEPVIIEYRYMNEIVNSDEQKAFNEFGLRKISGGDFIQCSIVLPKSMQLLLEDLQEQRSLVDPADTSLLDKYDTLKNKIIKWALYNFCPKGYKIDSSSISSAIFSLQQTGGNQVSTLLRGESGSMIITCAGDSLVSPHFYSGTGLTTGRDASDVITKVIEDAHQGQVPLITDFIDRLDGTLPLVTETALRMGENYVESRDYDEIKQAAYAATLKQLEKFYRENHGLLDLEIGCRIISISQKETSFELEWINRAGRVKKVLVHVNEEGKLDVSGTLFGTIKTLILNLQNL